jgi:hypothetical protein
LADVLPGEVVIYLENPGVAGRSLQTVLQHLDGLYGTTLASNPVMAQSQLDKLICGPREPAYRTWYARHVMLLATAAAVAGEDIDLKAPCALVKGINFQHKPMGKCHMLQVWGKRTHTTRLYLY